MNILNKHIKEGDLIEFPSGNLGKIIIKNNKLVVLLHCGTTRNLFNVLGDGHKVIYRS